MPQLLVRNIESAIVTKLRRQAAATGVSVEEAHRRLLRSALFGDVPEAKEDFISYLRSAPIGEEVEFPRNRDLPRPANL